MEQTTEQEKVAPAVVVKDSANGVTRPKAGTTCGRVWDICNQISEAANAPAERGAVISQATAEGINAATVATQHGKWRKYHGLTAMTPDAKAAKLEAAATAKLEKEAAAAAKKEAAAAAKQAKVDAKALKAAQKAESAGTSESDVSVETGTEEQ